MTGHLEDDTVLEGVSSHDLLHILTCATCRSWLIGKLLDQGLSPRKAAAGRENRPRGAASLAVLDLF